MKMQWTSPTFWRLVYLVLLAGIYLRIAQVAAWLFSFHQAVNESAPIVEL